MKHRSILQFIAACALSFTVLGSPPILAQHDPHPAATAAASTPTTQDVPVSGNGELVLGDLRTIESTGRPMVISPDGKWLAGPGPDEDFCIWDVASMNPSCGSDRKRMSVQLETITWAPDSSAVAFSLDAARLLIDSDIYVMDVDGTLHDLTDDGPDDKLTLSSDAPNIPVDMYPAWSPDSSELVFARTQWGGGAKSTALFSIDRSGGEPTQRFVVSGQEPFIIYSPMHWLDDGTVIFSVLHSDPGNKQNGVWRLTASGGVERILAGDEAAEIPIPFVNDVSPDGSFATVYSMIGAAQFSDDGSPVYFIVNLETGDTHPLEAANPELGVRIIAGGTFLPDGKSVLSVQTNGNAFSFVLFDLDGAVIGSAELPEEAGPPATFRGVSMASDGTTFIPTTGKTAAGGRGGSIIPVSAS